MKRLNEMIGPLKERLRRMQETQQYWRDQVANAKLTNRCQVHGIDLAIDVRMSVAESIKSEQLQIVWLPCQQCVQFDDEQLMLTQLQVAAVPKSLLHCSFEGYHPETDSQAKALEAAKQFASRPAGFFWLTGADRGIGKSHLAVAIMRVAIEGGIQSGFITHDAFVSLHRDSYAGKDNARERITAWQRRGLLVFDDLGATDLGARDTTQILHTLFTIRFAEKLPTVITSNMTRDAIAPLLGDRLRDRMKECFAGGVVLTGTSKRQTARQAYIGGNYD